jgi:hypothetical protein
MLFGYNKRYYYVVFILSSSSTVSFVLRTSFFAHTFGLDYEYHIRRAVSASVRTVHFRFLRMYRLLFSYIEEIKLLRMAVFTHSFSRTNISGSFPFV